MSEDYLTVVEAAEKLSVSPRTVQRYCKQGRLNYKWVTGKRHKELRIIPPIPISDLPGVRRKRGLNTFDYVTRTDFENTSEQLKQQLLEKDRRIEELEHEVAQLQSLITPGFDTSKSSGISESQGILQKKAESLLNDFVKVRPIEKKLILKMAKEIQAHGEYLRSLRMEQQDQDDSSRG